LPVSSPLVHARRVIGNQAGQLVGPIQMRGGAGVHHGTRGDQTLGGRACRGVERMEAARPPLATPIGIGTEIEQHVDHRRIAGVRHDRRRVEGKQRLVDPLAELGMLDQATHGAGIPAVKGVMKKLPAASFASDSSGDAIAS
jgi:hypothetical protein